MNWGTLTTDELFAALPEPALVITADGAVLAGNPCACDLFETETPFPSVNVVELLTQPERARLNPLEWLGKWADRPDAPELEYVYLTCRTESGAEKQLSVRVSKMESGDYLVTMHDVSRWEERLHAERDAHRLASRVLAISADAVVIVDEQHRVTYANASAEKLFGYSGAELAGMPLSALLPERYRDDHERHMQGFVEGSVPARMMGERSAVVALTKTGEEVPVEASITRVSMRRQRMFSAHLRDLRGPD
jgi:PAS domain S-box-containing protein